MTKGMNGKHQHIIESMEEVALIVPEKELLKITIWQLDVLNLQRNGNQQRMAT